MKQPQIPDLDGPSGAAPSLPPEQDEEGFVLPSAPSGAMPSPFTVASLAAPRLPLPGEEMGGRNRDVPLPSERRGNLELTEEEQALVLCPSCRHCWERRTIAAVVNRNVGDDGEVLFTHRLNLCLVVPRRPVPLRDLPVIFCNRYEERR